jgi:hypothetical protein
MNIQQLFNDYSIPFVTEGHKHCQPGWVNLECPFCVGNPGYHLGWNESGQYFHCWRCGGKFPNQVISKLLHISIKKAEQIILDYGGIKKQHTRQDEPAIKIRLKKFKYPAPLTPLQPQHIRYLEKRRFDAHKLELQWKLMATSPISLLDRINYNYRILAPIIWNNEVVSFQARDITNKHPLKYMACTKEREIIHHKHILYGLQDKWEKTGICVEGITDVWRMGVNSFATFGIEYTNYQVREIAQRYSRVAVLFDGGEVMAVKKANQMVADLKFRGVDAFRVDIIGDPANLSQAEADYLVKQIT